MLRLLLFCAIFIFAIVGASDSSCAEDDDGIPTSTPIGVNNDDAVLAKQLVRPIKENDVLRYSYARLSAFTRHIFPY